MLRVLASVVGVIIFTGCATTQTGESGEGAPTAALTADAPPDAPIKESAVDPTAGPVVENEPAPPASSEETIARLQRKVDELEERLSQVNAKLTSTRASFDNILKIKGSETVGVHPHPVDQVSTTVSAGTAPTDPEFGFINTEAVQRYREALIHFETAQYSEAVLAFSSFLKDFADHPFAGAAQYYIGESYFRQKEFKLAREEFQRVLVSYENSDRVPDTLRRLGDTEEALSNTQASARYRQMQASLFPQLTQHATENNTNAPASSEPTESE